MYHVFNKANDNTLEDPPTPPQVPENLHMASNERTLRDYTLPSLDMVQESIMRSTITTNNFKIKLAMIQMIQNNLQFRGIIPEDPNKHLKQFLQHCDTFKYNRVTNDAIRLRFFPFSLINNAFSLLQSQAPRSITTWDEIAGKFLQKFFPISKAVQLRREIIVFYNGLDANARSGLYGEIGGAFLIKTYEDAYELIENMAFNSYQWPIE
ncbi:RING-H2 finger protein ATL63 [Gossypium australe]|uniref:RING-H2 finger protein ATL63 n=1 Tax=Gossypium australe TaxID=47621 RepID=A0A5B6UIX8_9ROSI|nr:RING-H2 finger protein ATL63 [Gossypium australe]